MLERKRISDAVESLRGRLEESSSCPAKSDRIISKCFPGVVQAYVTKAGKKDSLPRKVAKSPPFSISIATEGNNRVKIAIRVSPDKRIQSAASLGIKASFLC